MGCEQGKYPLLTTIHNMLIKGVGPVEPTVPGGVVTEGPGCVTEGPGGVTEGPGGGVEPLKNATELRPSPALKETAPHSFNAPESARESRHHVQLVFGST